MGQSASRLSGNKGADRADDVKRQVDSDDNQQKTIYQLVNVKSGGGRLIDLMKSSVRTSTSSSLNRSTDFSSSSQRQIDIDVS